MTPEKSAFPFTAFVPSPMAQVAPVAPEGASATGEAPLAVAATGAQAAAEEKVAPEVAAEQRHDVPATVAVTVRLAPVHAGGGEKEEGGH